MPYFDTIKNAASMTLLIIIILTGESTARELRPSDHGLEYQVLPPTALKSPELSSFFGETTSSSTPSTVALPKAMNSNDTWWWRDQQNNRRGNDHVRHVLLLGSLICGVTGVALLAASAFIYAIKIKSFSASNK